MVPFGDDQETQVVDADSPSSGARFEDSIHDTDDYLKYGLDQNTVPFGDTLPIENLEPILCGETQVLDPDCGFSDGYAEIDNWVKTQILDGYEHTAVVDNGDKGTERTEVLSDGEGSSDGGATPGGARSCGEGLEKRGMDPTPCSGAQGKKELVVDSDASTDEEGGAGDQVSSALLPSGGSCKPNNGYVRRNFAAVRAASLRSSGLAAARSISPNTIDAESKSSFSNGKYCKEQDHDAGGQAGSRVSGEETWPISTTDLTHIGTKSGKIDWNHENENCHRDESKNRINNPRVRKLFNEMTSSEKEETTMKPSSTIGEVDSPCSLVPDYAVAGLSYIGSQQPGDLSQDNALDVVDKFLLVNDLGSSQDANTGKTDTVKSPPISSAKGALCLAKKADRRSPVGKQQIFEWINSLEDEGGGEFFSRRKDSFFESRGGARKSRSQPPKCRHLSSSMANGAVDKSGEEGVNPKTRMKIMGFTRSDSRLMLHSSSRNEKVRVSEAKTRKNLFKDMDEQSNSKSQEQQLEVSDVRVEEHIYDVGPDTQMAAEAMEALVHGSPINYETAGKLAEIRSDGATMKITSSKNVSLRKRTSTKPEGVSTRSKQRKTLSTKSRGSPSFSRSNSRGKKSLEDTTIKTKAKRGKRKLGQNSNARSSINRNESSISLKGEKALITVDISLVQEVDKSHSSLTLNDQLSVSKELIPGEYHINSSPVAHRTRHSKAVNILKKTEILYSECGEYTNGLMDVSTPGAISREDKLVANVCETLKSKRKGCNIVSDRTAKVRRNFRSHIEMHDIDGLHEEEAKASSPKKDAFAHPKGRKTSQITSGNPNIKGNLNNPSVSVDGIGAKAMKPSTRQRKIRATVKSVSEILDTAKRKKRSVTRMASRTDGIPFDNRKGKVPFISGVRTRSSVNYPSCKPYLDNDSKECLAQPVLYKAGSTDAVNICSTVDMNHSVHPKDVAPPKQGTDSISHVEVAEENTKLEESIKEKRHPSGLACTTPSKDMVTVSPVCVAQDPSRASCNKSLSRSSVARELLRLEATETSPVLMLNMRKRKDLANVCVLFSNHLDEDILKQQKKIMACLGLPVTSSISDATHFVTDKFVRTRNMLAAMALGKPVVTHMWLESCGQASCFIDEKNYILRDAKKEKEIGFSMPVSLARACQHPLLQDRRVFITPNAKPDQEVICSLVKAAYGQPMKRIGRSAMKDDKVPDDLLVLSCEEDYSVCIPLLEKGAEIYSSELLLNGIVIQKLEYERHRLFLDHVKRTRSTIWLRWEGGSQFLPVTKCT